jgi:hypothetical protein
VGLRVAGSIADLDAGRPLRVEGCGSLDLPAGETRLELPPAALAPYLIRLRSPAPRAASGSVPGRVVSAGRSEGSGRTGIRLALTDPARLVLAEGFTTGRRARCDGRDLGAPSVADGYATSWLVPASCRVVDVSFAPDRLVRAGYAVSLLAGLALLALLIVRRPPPPGRAPSVRAAAAPAALPVRRAALVAVVAGLVLGFVFAARATPLFALAAFVVAWRGIGPRALALAGGALLAIAVPVLTALVRPENRGGYDPEYASDGIAAHWVAVAGVALLVLALARTLSTARARRGRARAARPSDGAPPARAP